MSSRSTDTGSSYFASLQSLRFVFCMLIFVCHYLHMATSVRFDYGGDAGVAFFFILSGFVLSHGYGRKVCATGFSLRRFMGRRIGRLYPLHIVTLLAALLIGMASGARFSVTKTAAHVLMIQGFTLSADTIGYGNGPSWFLGALLLCYALFPAIYKTVATGRRSVAWAVGTAYVAAYVAVVSRCSDNALDDYLYAFPLLRIGEFALGAAAYRMYTLPATERLKGWIARRPALSLTVCDVAVVALCASTFPAYPLLPLWGRLSLLFWGPWALLVYWFAASDGSRGGVSRLLRCRCLTSLGGISFEIYMIHCIVIEACNFAWGRTIGYDTIPNCAHFVLCLVATVVAALIYAALERKWRKAQIVKTHNT